jgi:hypothetical protein
MAGSASPGGCGESGEFGEFVSLGSEARTKFQRQALACSPAVTPSGDLRPGGRSGPRAFRHFKNLHILSDSWQDAQRP